MNKSESSRPEKSGLDRAEHATLFGPPPLFDEEDTKAHDQLLTQVSTTVAPLDIFEDIWIRDVVDLTLEVFRLRRLTASLIKANEYKGLSETLAPLLGQSQAETLSEGWAARKPDVVEEVKKTLASSGLSADTIFAQTFALKVNEIERIQHMIALAEARRNATLREIDRHRQTLGQKLRRAAQQLEDGQMRVIEHTTSIDGANT